MEEITELEKKYYKLLIGETFHCYDITLNEFECRTEYKHIIFTEIRET